MVQHNQPVPSDSFIFNRTGHRIRNRAMLAAMTNKQSHSDGTLSESRGFGLRVDILASAMIRNAEQVKLGSVEKSPQFFIGNDDIQSS